MKQSDFDENGDLKPGAQRKANPDGLFPFFDININDVECGARIRVKGKEPSEQLERQLLFLCEQRVGGKR